MDPSAFHQMMDQAKRTDPEEPPAEEENDALFRERRYTPWQTNPVTRKNSATAQKRSLRLWRQRINARSPA